MRSRSHRGYASQIKFHSSHGFQAAEARLLGHASQRERLQLPAACTLQQVAAALGVITWEDTLSPVVNSAAIELAALMTYRSRSSTAQPMRNGAVVLF
jgi:hypothetical protein